MAGERADGSGGATRLLQKVSACGACTTGCIRAGSAATLGVAVRVRSTRAAGSSRDRTASLTARIYADSQDDALKAAAHSWGVGVTSS